MSPSLRLDLRVLRNAWFSIKAVDVLHGSSAVGREGSDVAVVALRIHVFRLLASNNDVVCIPQTTVNVH